MKAVRGWIILTAIAIAIAAAAYVLQPKQDSPEHSSNSDAANGASAALLYAQAMGHPSSQVTGSFELPEQEGSMMLVFTPTSPYTADDAQRMRHWVSAGGVLVYASEQGDSELDRAFGVTRYGAQFGAGTYQATPVVGGVARVAGGAGVNPLSPSALQVTFLRTAQGFSTGYIQKFGVGYAIVLADPLVLCNGYLEKLDNGRLLADLFALVSPGARVVFDEYHHGLIASDFAPQAWLLTPWGVALLWLLVAVFFGLLLRGRRFGPIVGRPPEVARSDVEWSVAVGQLLRRTGARAVTLGVLANAAERAVATRTGLPLQPRERFWNALWVRAPETAAQLANVESSLFAASSSERDLLEAARRLHDIAHPPTQRR